MAILLLFAFNDGWQELDYMHLNSKVLSFLQLFVNKFNDACI